MSHIEQTAYVEWVKGHYPRHFKGCRVLEVGSKNINGSVRKFFRGCDYTGLDCSDGPDVDVVCLAHEFRPAELFDTVITCEALEHDPHWRLTIPHVLSLLRPGGLFVGTWGGPERPEHGTRRTEDAGGTWGPDVDYYGNVSAEEFTPVAAAYLDPLTVQTCRGGQDVYAVGERKAPDSP